MFGAASFVLAGTSGYPLSPKHYFSTVLRILTEKYK
jgi:hypothetical protein